MVWFSVRRVSARQAHGLGQCRFGLLCRAATVRKDAAATEPVEHPARRQAGFTPLIAGAQDELIIRIQKQVTGVTVHLPSTVELTKRSSGNSLKVEAWSGKTKLGTLYVGRGSVEWWPGGNKVNAHGASWRKLADVFEQLPRKRSASAD